MISFIGHDIIVYRTFTLREMVHSFVLHNFSTSQYIYFKVLYPFSRRYLLYHWPIISALSGVGTVMFFLAALTLLSWYKFGDVAEGQTDRSTTRLTLEERRSRIRALLDRERSK